MTTQSFLPFLFLAALSTSACTIKAIGGFYDKTPESSSKGGSAENDAKGGGPKDEDPNKVTTGLPATAAHPSIAWFVERADDVPDVALGATAQTTVDAAKAGGFVAEIAIGNIAASVLKSRHLPKTAAVLAGVQPIVDTKSLAAAKALVATARKTGEQEITTLDEWKSDAQKYSEWTFEPLEKMLGELENAITTKKAPIRDRMLAPWVEIGKGDGNAETVTGDLPLYVTLLKTGTAPKRTTKTTTSNAKWIHPSIRYFFRAIASWPIEDASQILGIDATDTWRGKNTEVAALAADFALRDLAPRILESCGDTIDAAKLRTTKPVKDVATLDVPTMLRADIDDVKFACATGVASLATSAARDAFRWEKQQINEHPYYARTAINEWPIEVRGMVQNGSYAAARVLLMKELQAFVTKLRAMPRRKETTRED